MWYHYLLQVYYQQLLVSGVRELEFGNACWDVTFVATLARERKAEDLLGLRKHSWIENEAEVEVVVAARLALVAM